MLNSTVLYRIVQVISYSLAHTYEKYITSTAPAVLAKLYLPLGTAGAKNAKVS